MVPQPGGSLPEPWAPTSSGGLQLLLTVPLPHLPCPALGDLAAGALTDTFLGSIQTLLDPRVPRQCLILDYEAFIR